MTVLQKYIGIPAITLVAGMLLFGCGPEDLEKVELITSGQDLPVQTVIDADYFYTDSATLKFRLQAPKLERFVGEEDPTVEFAEGIHLRFFDKAGKVESELKANYAIRHEKEGTMEARNDVEVINEVGDKLNTEHLVWNEKEGKIRSDAFVKITQKTQIIYGDGLEANQDFSKYKILKVRGIIDIEDEDLLPAKEGGEAEAETPVNR